MKSNYWSCSVFADKVRGTAKPNYATLEEWKEWKLKAKKDYPFRFWLAEEFLDNLQNFIFWPKDKLYSLKYYIVNRWIDQSHALVAHAKHIKPGGYMDYGTRILYCLFDELVDFVEIETAYSYIRWDEEEVKKKKWWQAGMWRLRTYRDPERGMQYLDWASTLTDVEWLPEERKHEAKLTCQALAAKEIKELYLWWTVTYPNRPDPYEASGWREINKKKYGAGSSDLDDVLDDLSPNKDRDEALDLLREIEANYKKENEEMLIRLIKIRASLWT